MRLPEADVRDLTVAVAPGREAALPGISDICGWPLRDLGLFDRTLLRSMAMLSRRRVIAVHGLEHIAPERDPFILALNHTTRGEALWVPGMLVLLRHGRRIHFFADWNFRMIPGVGLLYRRAGAITVPRKPARPRFLNVLKPLFTDKLPPMEQARRHLASGRPVGIFPEGTVNRDPARLLRGRYGAARLSLETGVPVVPAGIRFPGTHDGAPPTESTPFELHIGPPLSPPLTSNNKIPQQAVQNLHAEIMTALSRLSGKSWQALK
ncbi:MAG: hypothetical protein RLZ98_2328 [Pseudomonadota bacterium]|jgi:1-acyl-sn-glycerol-3-phosphate acyltransferase